MKYAMILALGLLASPAMAQGPSFDCGQAEGAVEELICTSPELSALDRELTRLFDLVATGPNMTDTLFKGIQAYQRGWIKGRDDCWKTTDVTACVQQAYATRIAQLRTAHADARAHPGDSLGPFPYTCPGFNDVISVTFINAGDPMAVVQWQDVTKVLSQGAAASGARYSDGQVTFWTKGDSAQFTTPTGKTVTCQQDDMG